MIFGKRKEIKENPAGQAILIQSPMLQPQKWDLREAADRGFRSNPIVFRCIDEIARAIGNLPIDIKIKGQYLENWERDYPFLVRPNPTESFDQFIKGCVVDYCFSGEIFFSAIVVGSSKVRELWRQSPIQMVVDPSSTGMPKRYVWKNGQKEISWAVDNLTGKSDMFFYKNYDPMDYWRGMPPLRAAGLPVDIHNSGMVWNYSLLKNGARPSGILKMSGSPDQNAVNRIRSLFKRYIQGSQNAGEIPMLTDGAEWQPVDVAPKDMDYINTMKEMSKYIASVFGVPLPLIDTDNSTYNNLQESKERFYLDTIIPLANSIFNHMSTFFQNYYNNDFEICIDMDDVPALEQMRGRLFDRLVKAVTSGVLSPNEARQAMGFDPVPGVADSLFMGSNLVPIEMVGMDNLTPAQKETALILRKAKWSEAEIKAYFDHEGCDHAK